MHVLMLVWDESRLEVNKVEFKFNEDAKVSEYTKQMGRNAVEALNAAAEGIREINAEDFNAGDAVNPNHYKLSCNGIECIDAIEAALGRDGCIDFCIGNAFKYLWRWREKNGVEDLCKAEWYITHARVLEGKK